MRIDIISATPDLLTSPLNTSIVKRAQDKGLVTIVVHNVRDYAKDKHKQIDDKPFGGGPGMVLKPEPFFDCIEDLMSKRSYQAVVFTGPGGKVFDQKDANRFSLAENLLIVAGHYRGIDDRVRQYFATHEISIGNFVLSGGELPALIIVDAVVRLVPGVLNDSESALIDSFMDEEAIAAPDFTRPAVFRGMSVPEVLLEGNHQAIKDWKQQQSKVLTEQWKKNNKTTE